MADFNKQKSSGNSDKKVTGRGGVYTGGRRAYFGGFLAAALALAGQWFLGQGYGGYEAVKLIQSMTSPFLFLGSSIVTASATIMALMLTLLSFINQTDTEFDNSFFKRIERIGFLATVALSGGVLFLLFLSMPIQESEQVPTNWFEIIYYVLISFSAVLSGLLVTIILMLFNAITSLIYVVRPSNRDRSE